MTGDALLTALRLDLARWRGELEAIPAGGGFDQQRTMLAAWMKEGQRLLDRLG